MSVTKTQNYNWVNEHNGVKKNGVTRYQIGNDPDNSWKTGLAGIQSMLGDALAANARVRSYGGKWSLNDSAICNDFVHDSKPLTTYLHIGDNLIQGQPLYPSNVPLSQRLYFVQCGLQVMQLNTLLEQANLALPTTGASNGQTLIGAISTGTHGSALHVGAMQDYVRGVHLVTSNSQAYFIQPSSGTLLTDGFANALGATPINDDDVFNSAKVAFGSFGVIHGLVIETVPLYMLEVYCQRKDYSVAAPVFPLLAAFDPNDTTLLTDFLSTFGYNSTGTLHQIDLTINPYSDTNNLYLRAMFKLPYDPTKINYPPDSDTRVGDDIMSIVGKLPDIAGPTIPITTTLLFGQVQTECNGAIQTPRNIFGDSTLYRAQDGGTSTEMSVSVADAQQAIDIVMSAMKDTSIPGVIGVRFMKPTNATIGFTHFAPLSCTIEIPSLVSDATTKGYQKIFNALDNAGIMFTYHWGQEGDYTPARVQAMYGDALQTWLDSRAKLLPTTAQQNMFSNDFMARCGLANTMGAVAV